MEFDNQLVAAKLRRWDKYLANYKLPRWEEIPDLGLYMEQIITLLTQYLNYLPQELKDEQFITAATINNYVRKKIMPGPVKKRYYRMHIAYLIIICSLKQSLSITTIQSLLPEEPSEEAIKQVYNDYTLRHEQGCELLTKGCRLMTAPLLGEASDSVYAAQNVSDLIMTTAVMSGFSRVLADKLLMLEKESKEKEREKEKVKAKEKEKPRAKKEQKA